MDLLTLFLLAVGLSMDAFAVSICKGLAIKKITVGKAAAAGIWFGGFQAFMPFIGYALGIQFAEKMNRVAPWIAFILLSLIGGNMIKESMGKEGCSENGSMDIREMFILALATSIDALAVGITFACVPVAVLPAGRLLNTAVGCIVIGITTCAISMAGVKIGNVFGTKYKNKAELAGGIILVLLGVKILMEHFGIFWHILA